MILEFKKVHDLIVLLKICQNKEPTLEQLIEECKFLNRFYIDTRYPVHWPTHYTFKVAKKAEESVRHIREIIGQLLNF